MTKEQAEKELAVLTKEKEKVLESIVYHEKKAEDEKFICQAIMERVFHLKAVLTNK